MKVNKVSIFLSYSHKDEEKVRQIRNFLEILNCEPLMFYLKCLDDDNDQLESFIQEEIQARNFFIYCRSDNAEKSTWVQKELDYIKSIDGKRLYTIDIEKGLSAGLIGFLDSISAILRKNRILFIGGGPVYSEIMKSFQTELESHNYQVVYPDVFIDPTAPIINSIFSSIKDFAKEGHILVFLSSSPKTYLELGFAMSTGANISLVSIGEGAIPVDIALSTVYSLPFSFPIDQKRVRKICQFIIEDIQRTS